MTTDVYLYSGTSASCPTETPVDLVQSSVLEALQDPSDDADGAPDAWSWDAERRILQVPTVAHLHRERPATACGSTPSPVVKLYVYASAEPAQLQDAVRRVLEVTQASAISLLLLAFPDWQVTAADAAASDAAVQIGGFWQAALADPHVRCAGVSDVPPAVLGQVLSSMPAVLGVADESAGASEAQAWCTEHGARLVVHRDPADPLPAAALARLAGRLPPVAGVKSLSPQWAAKVRGGADRSIRRWPRIAAL